MDLIDFIDNETVTVYRIVEKDRLQLTHINKSNIEEIIPLDKKGNKYTMYQTNGERWQIYDICHVMDKE